MPMERCWPHENVMPDSGPRTVVVGLGNSFHGDDGAGCIVARCIFEILSHEEDTDLLELSCSGFAAAESLIGYQRAVIIDTLVDRDAKVGTVRRVELPGPSGPGVSLHTNGFGEALALAGMVGLRVPDLSVYGIVIREPSGFSDFLSGELVSRIPGIVSTIAVEVSTSG